MTTRSLVSRSSGRPKYFTVVSRTRKKTPHLFLQVRLRRTGPTRYSTLSFPLDDATSVREVYDSAVERLRSVRGFSQAEAQALKQAYPRFCQRYACELARLPTIRSTPGIPQSVSESCLTSNQTPSRRVPKATQLDFSLVCEGLRLSKSYSVSNTQDRLAAQQEMAFITQALFDIAAGRFNLEALRPLVTGLSATQALPAKKQPKSPALPPIPAFQSAQLPVKLELLGKGPQLRLKVEHEKLRRHKEWPVQDTAQLYAAYQDAARTVSRWLQRPTTVVRQFERVRQSFLDHYGSTIACVLG